MSLTTLHLTAVVRAGAELAEATSAYRPENHPEILAAQADPLHKPGSLPVDVLVRWDESLSQIVESANRLKKALGATGKLRPGNTLDDSPPPSWPNFRTQFEDTDYSRNVRIGLQRLANSAIDLSGFAYVTQPPEYLRRLGLLELDRGLRQIWPALSPKERKEVQPSLRSLRFLLQWPKKPASDPPRFSGPTEITDEEMYRIIDLSGGYYTRGKDYLEVIQQATTVVVPKAAAPSPASIAGAKKQTSDEVRSPPATDGFAQLRNFACEKLKGIERAVIEALCASNGQMPIEDLALRQGVSWDDPIQGFKDVQTRLHKKDKNGKPLKLKAIGWTLSRCDNTAKLVNMRARKSS